MSNTALPTFLAQSGLFRSLIDQSPLMVLVFDPAGGCAFSSRARLAFGGRTPEQDQEWGWVETVHPEDKAFVSASVLDAIADRKPFTVEHRVFRGDGALRWISSQGVAWFSPGGEYQGHVAIAVDITDQRPSGAGGLEEPRFLRRL